MSETIEKPAPTRRWFQEDSFCDAATLGKITRRTYDDGSVEFWGMRFINFANGQSIPHPYRIEANDPGEAVARIESAWKLVEEQALADIRRQIAAAQLMAPATGPVAKKILKMN